MVGYKTDLFVREIDQHLICPLCKNVFKNPVNCKHGHSFCNDCIKEWLKKSDVCPVDGNFIGDKKSDLPRNLSLNEIIDHMQVYCHKDDSYNYTEGTPVETNVDSPEQMCDWTGPLDHLPNHKQSCPFQQVQCPNENCDTMMRRRDMEEHEEICAQKKVKCEDCSDVVLRKELEKHREDECEGALIPCPNKCLVKVRRKDVQNHLLNICPKELSECPLKEHGCSLLEQVERQHVVKHLEENVASHIILLAKQNSKLMEKCSFLAQQNKQLRESLRNLEEELSSSYIWTIHDFPSKSREHVNGEWFKSPAFWLCGCKWYLKLFPNGNNNSSEGFLSLSLKLDDEDDGAESHVPWYSDSAVVIPNSAISVLYKLTVVSQKPGFQDVSLESATVYQRSESWGYSRFMKTDDALSEAYCNSTTGALVIKCTIKLCRPE